MRYWLCELHETMASSFAEVQVQCLSFFDKGAKAEEMIDWILVEVKAVPDTVWWLNDNFAILGIEGVLNMLNNKGCQELDRLHELATSRDAAVMEDVPEDVRKLVGWIMQRWWKPHGMSEALHRIEVAYVVIVSHCDN
jgi:hypothetical protein